MNKNLLIVLVFLLFNIGYGQTLKTWTGATSTDWEERTNWSPVGVPTGAHNVLITNATNQPVITDQGVSCATLTLSNSTPGSTIVLTVKGGGAFYPSSIIMNSGGGDTSDCSLNIGAGGTVSTSGNITMTGTALQNDVTFSGDGNLVIGGIMTGGILNSTGMGTVNYAGSGTLAVGAYTYNNLTLSGSGVRTITTSDVVVNGIFTIASSATASAAPTYGSAASLKYNATSLTVGPEWVTPFSAKGGVEIMENAKVTLSNGSEKRFNDRVPLIIGVNASLAVTNTKIYLGGNFVNNRGRLTTDQLIYLTGSSDQNIGSFTSTVGVAMIKNDGTATFTGGIDSKQIIIDGLGGTLDLGDDWTHTFTDWVRTQGTLDGGSSLLKISGNVIGTGGTFTPGAGTVEFNGGAQNLGAGSITYNNLVLSGSGTKTFGAVTTINDTFSIVDGVKADLTANLVHTAKSIKLGAATGSGGSWGSSLSNAVNKNNTFFISNNGIVNVGPTIVISTTNIAALTSTYGTPSSTKSFDISALAMQEGILVTAPEGFEVSTDETNFSNSLTIGAAGAIASTKVFVRLKGTIDAKDYSGDIILTSNGTTTINIAIAKSTVNKATLLITAEDKDINYGDAIPTFTASYDKFVNGDTPASLGTAFKIDTKAIKGSNAGTYDITVSGANSSNYEITYGTKGTLTIKKLVLIITTNSTEKTYGSINPDLTMSYSGFASGETEVNLTTKPEITTTALQNSPVLLPGYPISAGKASSPNYTFDYKNTGLLIIKPAALTIKAVSIDKTHGDENPVFTVEYDKFVNGDTSAQLVLQVIITTDATKDSALGNYDIKISGASSPNYNITFVNGVLYVIPSKDAGLSDIVISDGTLDKPFDTDKKGYTVEVPNDTNSYVINPIPSNPNATVEMQVDGKVIDPTTPLDLKVGDNEITVVVTAEDGTTQETYTVIVTRDPSSNAGLTDLAISQGTLNPAFAEGITAYTATVPNDITTINVTPVTADATATVTINGVVVPSGIASGEIPLQVGENTITTVVTAQDGTTTTYTVVVTREPSSNAGLSDIVISDGTLSPAFNSNTYEYRVEVPNEINSYVVNPITIDPTATVEMKVDGKVVDPTSPIDLKVGENEITMVVTAADGTTQDTYTVIVTRDASNNSGLTDLAISEGILSPAFAEGTTAYTATVPNDVANITVTPVTADTTATITVNGVEVLSGTASADLPLQVGENTITTVVRAQDGTTTTYTVVVTREPSSNAGLSDIVISDGTLSPAFNSNTYEYRVEVPNEINSYVVNPITIDPTATVEMKVDGKVVDPTSPIDLNVGENVITMVVTAADGTTQDTYTVIVTRDASNNSGLTDLAISQGTLSPAFAEGTTAYTATVPNDVANITVTPVTADTTATVTINGIPVPSGTASADLPLQVGENTITTVVTAQDGTITTYTVVVTREPSSNAGLSDIVISDGTLSPAFNSNTYEYRVEVPNEINSYVINPKTIDPTATVEMKVDGKVVDPTSPIDLNVGENVITMVVTAADGTTQDTYTVIVTRDASNNSGLTDLAISQGTLSPAFAEGTTAYTATVPNDVANITVTPVTADTTATITVNGVEVPSGTASADLPLQVGENTITTVVTAQDGTITTYTVVVTREEATPSSNAGLADIVISDGSLSPAFNTDTHDYKVDVPYETNSIVITPITIDPAATVEMIVDGKTIDPTAPIDLKVGENVITVVVTAEDGTQETYTVIVNRADDVPQVLVPSNIITPNGDGKNDFWDIPGIDKYPKNSVKVFDRAARLVYSKDHYNNDWDGTYKGSPLTQDTYYYLIDLGSGLPKIKGFITIIRD